MDIRDPALKTGCRAHDKKSGRVLPAAETILDPVGGNETGYGLMKSARLIGSPSAT